MSRKRRSTAGAGFSSFLTTVFLAFIIVALSQIYPRFKRNQRYTADLNHVRTDFSAQHWAPAIEGYLKLWKDYPDKERADVYNVAAAHENWAVELYTGSLSTRSNWAAAADEFEKAAELRPLGESSLISLGDCSFELGRYERCREILKEADARSEIDGARFGVLRKRLEKAEGTK